MANGFQGRCAPKPLPAAEILSSYFSYDPLTGIIVWKPQAGKNQRWNTQFAGQEAGCIAPNGYKQIRLNGEGLRYHRVAWALLHRDCPTDVWIDHANGDPLDNRASNLRLASRSENARNAKRRDGCRLPRGVKRHHRGVKFWYARRPRGRWSSTAHGRN